MPALFHFSAVFVLGGSQATDGSAAVLLAAKWPASDTVAHIAKNLTLPSGQRPKLPFRVGFAASCNACGAKVSP